MIERQRRRRGRRHEREISGGQAKQRWLVCCFGQSCDNLSCFLSPRRRTDEHDWGGNRRKHVNWGYRRVKLEKMKREKKTHCSLRRAIVFETLTTSRVYNSITITNVDRSFLNHFLMWSWTCLFTYPRKQFVRCSHCGYIPKLRVYFLSYQ